MHIAHAQRAVAATRQAVSWVMSSTSMCTPSPLSVPPNRTTSPSLPNTPSPFHLFSSRSTLTGLPLALCATGTPAAKLHRVVSETSPQARACMCIRASTLSESDSTFPGNCYLVRRRSYQSPMCVAVGHWETNGTSWDLPVNFSRLRLESYQLA